MENLLDSYDQPKPNQEDEYNLNKFFSRNENKAVIDSPKKEKSRTGQIRFTSQFYQNFNAPQTIP
jgi:hypothetical protein